MLIDLKLAMGERYQDVKKPSVCLRSVVPSNLFLICNTIAMKTCPKSLVILMERRRRHSFCWQVVRTKDLPLACGLAYR